ncbi:MAG TPA: HAMP domain-containing sensor histidine kinase [Acidimicrobiales bacterium]
MKRRPRGGLGRFALRTRVTLAFGLGTLLLSSLLVVLSYSVVRENLINERQSTATRQVFVNARVMRDALRTAEPDVPRLLASLETPAGSRPLLFQQGRWFAQSFTRGRDALPLDLRERVIGGAPATMRYVFDDRMALAIGVPIPAVDAAYFEVADLSELGETLDFLRFSLLGAAAVTTVAGAALGAWVAVRVLRPLSAVALAASAIAEGDLAIRLEGGSDTELASLAASFNEMAGALQERIERDARFASDVSHELRSPLTTLASSIEVLESRRDELSERGQAALDLLSADIERFTSMVEDLLEISRFEPGKGNLHLEPVWLAELVRYVLEAHHTTDDVRLVIAENAAEAFVSADKRRLIRVIGNLIENADSHGEGIRQVVVEGDNPVRVTIDDLGAGVDPEDRDLIFERFARGRGSHNRSGSEGAGLGLALVAEHVALHRGRVWVEDAPEGGARFVVELPRFDPSVPDDEGHQPLDQAVEEVT